MCTWWARYRRRRGGINRSRLLLVSFTSAANKIETSLPRLSIICRAIYDGRELPNLQKKRGKNEERLFESKNRKMASLYRWPYNVALPRGNPLPPCFLLNEDAKENQRVKKYLLYNIFISHNLKMTHLFMMLW